VGLGHMNELDMSSGARDCWTAVLLSAEPWRIIRSTLNFNVQMGLGPLAEGYALILSKRHFSCCAELPQSDIAEFENLVRTVRKRRLTCMVSRSCLNMPKRACLPPEVVRICATTPTSIFYPRRLTGRFDL